MSWGDPKGGNGDPGGNPGDDRGLIRIRLKRAAQANAKRDHDRIERARRERADKKDKK